MPQIDISVVIPVYNASRLISRCIDSILSQKGNYTFEVIFIDDGSTDSSCEIIKSYNNPYFILLHQENAGPARARNKGIEMARGEYLSFLDADDYWMPEFFYSMISFMRKHPSCIAASTGQVHKTVGGESIIASETEQELDEFFCYWSEHRHICTGSMIAKTDKLKKLGGQRTDLRVTEDLEFWALIATQGKWGVVPGILFVSDGTDTIKDSGWLKKMKIRWESAPTIEEWRKRIVHANPQLLNDKAYNQAEGWISRNLTYCMLLAKKENLAREEAKKYGRYFPNDLIARLMNMCKPTQLSWWLMCKLLQYREYHR